MRSFRLNVLLRIIFLSANIFFFFDLLEKTELITTYVIIGALVFVQIYFLFKFVDKTNTEISKFLLSIKYSDFSQSFNDKGLGKSFKELSYSFSEVIKKFQKTRTEKEEQFRYLNTVTQHVGVGLLAFDEKGNVELINQSAKQLLKIKYLKNISSLERVQSGLSKEIASLEHGKRRIFKLADEFEIFQLIMHSTEFKMRGHHYKLVSIQNIHGVTGE